jgi:hypothetical protein
MEMSMEHFVHRLTNEGQLERRCSGGTGSNVPSPQEEGQAGGEPAPLDDVDVVTRDWLLLRNT